MCNCGRKREHFTLQQQTPVESRVDNISSKQAFTRFEYIGKTALTVTGSNTGERYRFDNPGSILQIDQRDAPGLMTIPVLRKALY